MRTIAQISDLHFGRHDPRVVDDLAASVAAQAADLVVISGDLTQRAKRSEFADAVRFLRRITQPKLVIPGNHDMPLTNIFGRMVRPFGRYERYVNPVSLPANLFRDDEIAVLGLNTARRFTGKNGRVSSTQLTEVGRLFRSLPDTLFRVLVTHHPLGAPGDAEPMELAHKARRTFEAISGMGVRLMLSGHHHQAASGAVVSAVGASHGTLAVYAGTAVSTRVRDGEGNSYNLMRIGKARVEIVVMGWDGGFREFSTRAFDLREGHWTAAG